MSYEGYKELLCAKGHYVTYDAYDSEPKECPYCTSHWEFVHSVDQTNGREEGNPSTEPAPKFKEGHDDVWHEDHYGNKYAYKRVRYRPGAEWRKRFNAYVSPED